MLWLTFTNAKVIFWHDIFTLTCCNTDFKHNTPQSWLKNFWRWHMRYRNPCEMCVFVAWETRRERNWLNDSVIKKKFPALRCVKSGLWGWNFTSVGKPFFSTRTLKSSNWNLLCALLHFSSGLGSDSYPPHICFQSLISRFGKRPKETTTRGTGCISWHSCAAVL